MDMRKKSQDFVRLGLLMLTLLLTGCVTSSPKELYSVPVSPRGYLYLLKGTPVQTKEGVYTPIQDEKWVSEAKYAELETKHLELIRAASAQGRQDLLSK